MFSTLLLARCRHIMSSLSIRSFNLCLWTTPSSKFILLCPTAFFPPRKNSIDPPLYSPFSLSPFQPGTKQNGVCVYAFLVLTQRWEGEKEEPIAFVQENERADQKQWKTNQLGTTSYRVSRVLLVVVVPSLLLSPVSNHSIVFFFSHFFSFSFVSWLK